MKMIYTRSIELDIEYGDKLVTLSLSPSIDPSMEQR